MRAVREKPVSETGPILAEILDNCTRKFADKYQRALKQLVIDGSGWQEDVESAVKAFQKQL